VTQQVFRLMSCHHAAIDALTRSAKSKEFQMPIFKCSPSVSFLLSLSVSMLASAVFAGQAMACYTVYNRANQPVYSNMASPIDMRYQIHERLPAAFPGGHMVFGSSTDCPLIDARTAVPQLSNVAVAATVKPATRRTRKSRSR
jgi:hypothetical protein